LHPREKWNEAYKIAKSGVTEKEYGWLEASRNDSQRSPGNIAEELRQKLEAKNSVKDKEGRQIFTRHRIHKLLESVKKYTIIVDVAVSHSPQIRFVTQDSLR
jgi:hypothetical protein